MAERRTTALDRSADVDLLPLTDEQLACWTAVGTAGGVARHYVEWELTDFDADRFRAAWRRLIARHDSLRAVACADGRQEVREAASSGEVPVHDLRGLDAEAAAEGRLAERARLLGGSAGPAEALVTLLAGGLARIHLAIDRFAADTWSLTHVLLPDLARWYADPEASAEPADYRACVLAAAAMEDAPAYEASRRYWLDHLPDLPPPPGLPTAPPGRGSGPEHRYREGRLTGEGWAALRRRARAHGIDATTVPLAAFAEVLRTWSTEDRFTINRPLFDRPSPDRVAGGFAIASPLAVDKADGTFADRARALRRRMDDDRAHRHFDGLRVLRELNRGRPIGDRTCFPVVFTDLLDRPRPALPGRVVHHVSPDPRLSVEVRVWEEDDALRFAWEWREDRFPPEMLDAMCGAYEGLMGRLAEDDAPWSLEHLPLVPEEQLALRARVNATEAPLPEGLLHTPVAEHARRCPDAPAVITSTRTLTFGELHRRVSQVGNRLRALGARPGRLVAIVMEKGWEQIVAAHGILAAGAAYLPIDPEVPAERLRFLLDYGEVEIALTQDRVDPEIPWPDHVRRLRVDRDFDDVDDTPPVPVQRQTDLAYVIFTSGSTGVPKGVMVDHLGALNTIHDANRRLGVGPSDRCLAVSGLHFDLSVYDTFGMIAAGGAVVVPDPRPAPAPDQWAELMERTGVTFWNSVPALIDMLMMYLELSGERSRIEALRTVILAGDWIPVTLPDRIRALNPRTKVIGSGGPAETCVWSVIYPIGEVDPSWTSIPYGRPMANQRYHVLDERLRPRPVWVPGEIYVASEVGLAHGYWHDEERTASRFRSVPGIGDRVYATGDMGRHLPDGDLEILGRADFQVKIQGIRIELGEIEATLAEHPLVRSAVAVAAGRVRDLPVLKAYVVGDDGVDVRDLRDFLSRKLPRSMVPKVITVLDRIPLTGNGKVDRMALASGSAGASTGAEESFTAPVTSIETVVCGICAELLGRDRVGTSDDLLRLGGDSRLMVELVARLRSTLGVKLLVPDLFASPSVRQICEAVTGGLEAPDNGL